MLLPEALLTVFDLVESETFRGGGGGAANSDDSISSSSSLTSACEAKDLIEPSTDSASDLLPGCGRFRADADEDEVSELLPGTGDSSDEKLFFTLNDGAGAALSGFALSPICDEPSSRTVASDCSVDFLLPVFCLLTRGW